MSYYTVWPMFARILIEFGSLNTSRYFSSTQIFIDERRKWTKSKRTFFLFFILNRNFDLNLKKKSFFFEQIFNAIYLEQRVQFNWIEKDEEEDPQVEIEIRRRSSVLEMFFHREIIRFRDWSKINRRMKNERYSWKTMYRHIKHYVNHSNLNLNDIKSFEQREKRNKKNLFDDECLIIWNWS